jgi:hypothetical protein
MAAECEWLVPGQPVVIATPGQWSGARVVDTTIDRVLRRDLVLANGERFRIASWNGRRFSRANGTWSPSTYLLHPDDQDTAMYRKEADVALLRSKSTTAFRAVEDAMRERNTAQVLVKARRFVRSVEALAEREAQP